MSSALIDNGVIEGASLSNSIKELPNTQPMRPLVKPRIKLNAVEQATEDLDKAKIDAASVLTPEQIIAASKIAEASVRKTIAENRYDASKNAQILNKEVAPIIDYTKLTQDDIFNMEIPINAKPFMDADILKVKLKDTNYEARWVNKNPQRMSDMMAKGFSYVTEEDLMDSLAHEVSKDSEGHYCYNDVVCMKIDKATYYSALRHAHLRAVNTTKQTVAAKKGMDIAAGSFREAGLGSDFEAARRENKMEFYTPGIEV